MENEALKVNKFVPEKYREHWDKFLTYQINPSRRENNSVFKFSLVTGILVNGEFNFKEALRLECQLKDIPFYYVDCKKIINVQTARNESELIQKYRNSIILIDNINEFPDVEDKYTIVNIMIHNWKNEHIVNPMQSHIFLASKPDGELTSFFPTWDRCDNYGWIGNILNY